MSKCLRNNCRQDNGGGGFEMHRERECFTNSKVCLISDKGLGGCGDEGLLNGLWPAQEN